MNLRDFMVQLLASVRASLAGGFSTLFLGLFWISVLLELPFVRLRRIGFRHGEVPKQRAFWVSGLLALLASVVLTVNVLRGLGIFNPVELTIMEPSSINPFTTVLWLSLLLCVAWFSALIISWKQSRRPLKTWWICWLFASLYLVLVVAMAYLRSEAVERIVAGLT